MSLVKPLLAFSCLAALLGCGGINPQVRTTADPAASLIYGYFDLSAAPHKLGSVRLTQGERAGIAYRQSNMTTYDDGLFFMENVPPMDYHIPWFMSGGKMHVFGGGKADVFKVPPSSLVFVGCYKYHDPRKGGIITQKKFEMRPSKSPSEREILQKLLTRVKDPRWKARIQARLKS